MGQKVNPIGFRVGVYRNWDAKWIVRNNALDSYKNSLLEDLEIRKYLNKTLDDADVSRVLIEKTNGLIKIIIYSGKPGVIIGKKGQEIDNIRSELSALLKKNNVEVSVEEEFNPELNAVIVAKNIAKQLEKRVSFKKLMKKAAASVMKNQGSSLAYKEVKGIKIRCKGRLNGAEIARAEWLRIGSVPLHTLRENIDYGYARALTTYGIIGVQVWISKGNFKKNRIS